MKDPALLLITPYFQEFFPKTARTNNREFINETSYQKRTQQTIIDASSTDKKLPKLRDKFSTAYKRALWNVNKHGQCSISSG